METYVNNGPTYSNYISDDGRVSENSYTTDDVTNTTTTTTTQHDSYLSGLVAGAQAHGLISDSYQIKPTYDTHTETNVVHNINSNTDHVNDQSQWL